jgi:hypothetical protein
MELVAVESSNVAAIGYNAECELLRVRFKDGGVYDYPGVSVELHERIMQAESKGRALAAIKHRAVKVGEQIQLREPTPPGPMQSFQEDSCCGKHLSKALMSGALDTVNTWECPTCGCEWRAQTIDSIRHWSPHDWMKVIR